MDLETPNTVAPLAISCRIHMESPRTTEINHVVISAHEKYIDGWGDRLRYGVEDDTGRFRKYVQAFRDFPRARYWDLPPSEEAYWMAHGGASKEADSPFLSYCALPSSKHQNTSSTIELNWNPSVWTRNYDELVQYVAEIVRDQPIAQGYVSHGFSQVNRNHAHHAKWAAAMRFHGIDLDERIVYIHATRGLKSPAWVTIVGDRFLEKLGGRTALKFRSSDIDVLELGRAVLIRAGESPTLGDQNAGDRTPLLREVAEVLKPARFYGHIPVPGPFMEWYARFDQPA
ncbi:MAG: DUF3396 domain-containing protein [Polyangiaceae bacterium]